MSFWCQYRILQSSREFSSMFFVCVLLWSPSEWFRHDLLSLSVSSSQFLRRLGSISSCFYYLTFWSFSVSYTSALFDILCLSGFELIRTAMPKTMTWKNEHMLNIFPFFLFVSRRYEEMWKKIVATSNPSFIHTCILHFSYVWDGSCCLTLQVVSGHFAFDGDWTWTEYTWKVLKGNT